MSTFNKMILGAVVLAVMACNTAKPVSSPAPAAAVAAEPPLLSQQGVDGTIYQSASAEVYRLYEQGYELARMKLDANLSRPHSLPPAVIVDVDETVLDNSPYQVTAIAKGHVYTPAEWGTWTHMASAPALPGAVEFLRYAAEKECSVYYITNRSGEEKNVTIKNLFELGFPQADEQHVMTMDATSDKTDRRALVAKAHYVALLVGDQLTDFDQSLKDRSTGSGKPHVEAMQDTLARYFVLLPNAMYGTWLDAVGGKDDATKRGNKARYFNEHAY